MSEVEARLHRIRVIAAYALLVWLFACAGIAHSLRLAWWQQWLVMPAGLIVIDQTARWLSRRAVNRITT